jgi:hypothetical protein
MISVMTIILLLALTTALVVTIERHHRRTWRLPHPPLGADAGTTDASRAAVDLDLDHVQHDLAARA